MSVQQLTDSARELAASARRYMTSGDGKELQRAHAIIDELEHEKARSTEHLDPAIRASLDEYELGILQATSALEEDQVQHERDAVLADHERTEKLLHDLESHGGGTGAAGAGQ